MYQQNIYKLEARPIEIFILSQLNQSYELIEKYGNHLGQQQSLKELRTIIAGGIRQAGSTTACARLFDPNKDIYISTSFNQIKFFNNILYESGIVKNKCDIQFKYFTMNKKYTYLNTSMKEDILRKILSIKVDDQSLNKLNRTEIEHELNTFSLEYPKNLRGKQIKPDAVYWFDLGNTISFERMNEIIGLIDFLDRIQGDGSQRYVIL